ncbi:hypothetical protein EDB89DRAFT_2205491 [Lactarius sanguifluus]|nr:hypothetical protein EDB89DRAFT_2205491 [Lactarius sanguifluus]
MRVWRGRKDLEWSTGCAARPGRGLVGSGHLHWDVVENRAVQKPEGAEFGGDSGEGGYGGGKNPTPKQVEPPELPQSRRTGGGEESTQHVTQVGTETTSPPAWQLRSRVARKRTHRPSGTRMQERQYHAVQVLCAERCKNRAPSGDDVAQVRSWVRCNALDDQRDNVWTGAHVRQVDSTYSLKISQRLAMLCSFVPRFNSFVLNRSQPESTLRRALRTPMYFVSPHGCILAANASFGSDTPTTAVEVEPDDGVRCCRGRQ